MDPANGTPHLHHNICAQRPGTSTPGNLRSRRMTSNHLCLFRFLCLVAVALCGQCTTVDAQASTVLKCYSTWTTMARDGYHCVQLSSNYLMYWRPSPQTREITFAIEIAHPNGDQASYVDWAGIGISEAGDMTGSDILAITRKPGSDMWQLQELVALEQAKPKPVNRPAARLVSVVAKSGVIRAVVTRPLDKCDPEGQRILLDARNLIIFAYGSDGTGFNYHGPYNRGSRSTYLTGLPYQLPQPGPSTVNATQSLSKDSPTVTQFRLALPPTPVPLADDFYMCVDLELPSDVQRHITSFEGSLQGSPRSIHHIVLYSCQSKPSTFGSGTYQCQGMPTECLQVSMVWTPGMPPQVYPPEAGYLIGPGGAQYASLQIHYNNVGRVKNLIDSSGILVTTTTALRPNNIGTLTLGMLGFKLPPQTQSVTVGPAICPSACTKRFKRNVTIVSTTPHMHMAGRSIVVKHVRNGQEMRPLALANYYQFHYQASYPAAPDTSTLMPGDTLITQCTFNTMDRKTNTTFGEGTWDEMCFAFLLYWPQQPDIDVCLQMNSKQTQDLGISTCSTASIIMERLNMSSNISAAAATNAASQLLIRGDIVMEPPKSYTAFDLYGPACKLRESKLMTPSRG